MNSKTTFSHIALATLAFAAPACTLEKADDVSEYREALPLAKSVAVAGPGTDAGGSRTSSTSGDGSAWLADGEAANGNLAKWYAFTRGVRDGVNVVTRDVLAGVWLIVHSEPSSVGADHAEWGPYSDALDPVSYRFRVERVAAGEYAYSLEGRPKASSSDADYRAVLSGTGYGRLDERHGDGTFTIDLEVARALDPLKHRAESGTVTIRHDLPANIARSLGALPRIISADITPTGGAWLHVESRANSDLTGSLDVDAHADTDDSKATSLEDVTVQSRWLSSGAGRADITVAGGDLPANIPVVSASECWGSDFARVYYADSVSLEPESGEAAACAFDEPEGQP
jgi:hypothetical protein